MATDRPLSRRHRNSSEGRRPRRGLAAASRGALASLSLGGLASLGVDAVAAAAQAAPFYRQRVLVDSLQNPRGLSLDGARLLVSEAGAGGPRLADGSNCFTAGSGAELCAGRSGAIGIWDPSTQAYQRAIDALPSLARSDGSEGTGIADLVPGGPTGLLGVFGLGGDPNQASQANLGSDWFGQVVSIDLATKTIQSRASLAAYEKSSNPDGETPLNSNPYALALFGGQLYSTDAGGNTLVRLDPTPDPLTGSFTILGSDVFATIPVTPPPFLPNLPNPFPAQAVPTGLAVDPTGQKLWIAELAGFPFVPGSASVFTSDGNLAPQPSLSGFTSITDIASGADGSLYVLEYAGNFFRPAGNGSVWRVAPDGRRDQIIAGLTQPTGLAVADDGTVYVTNNADSLEGELREYRPSVPGPLPLLGAAAAWGQARSLRRRANRGCRPSTPGQDP
ncbi:MAG: ScyD/ScyE family protein [Synechococcaceae cyanobacterium]